MGSPTINGAGLENNQQGNAAGLSTNPQELQAQLDALFTPEMAENAFKKFKESLDGDTLDLTQGGFNEILTAIAIPLAMMNPRALEDSIDFASKHMSDDQLFQMAGVIPEPMQSRLRALEQQGGAFNTALGESNQQINERKQKERRASEFTQAAMMAAARAAAVNKAVEDFKEEFDKDAQNYALGMITFEQLNQQTADNTNTTLTTLIEERREAGDSDVQIVESVQTAADGQVEVVEQNDNINAAEKATLTATIIAERDKVLEAAGLTSERVLSEDQALRQATSRLYKPLGTLISSEAVMCTPEDAAFLQDDLSMFLDDSYDTSDFNIMEKDDLLAVIEGQLRTVKDNATKTIADSEINIAEAQNFLDEYADDLDDATKEDMNNVISEAQKQIEIANLQLEISDISAGMVDALKDKIPDNLTDMTPQQIKAVITQIPPELFAKTNEIKEKMSQLSGYDDETMRLNDPMQFMQENMEQFLSKLDPADRQEVMDYFNDFSQAQQDVAEKNANFEAAAEAQASMISPDGILMNDGGMGRIPGIVSPIASQQMMTDMAYNEMREANERLESLAAEAGVELPSKPVDEGVVITPDPQTPEEMYGDWDPELEQIARNLVANGTTSPEDIEAALDAGNFIGLGMGESYSRDKLNSFLDEFSGEQPLSKPAPIVASAEPTPETSTEDTRNVTSAAQQYDDPDNGPPFTNAPNLRSEFGAVNGQAYTAPAPDAQPAIDQQVALQQQQQNNAGMGKPV